MSSSGEEDQAVHGSSAPPAAAAQTVAVPHTGLGNCRLRGAQCACAAPAVAVPPVLMLKLLLRLLPRWPSPGRGLSISTPAPSPGAGEPEEPTQAPVFPSLSAQTQPHYCALLPPCPSPPISGSPTPRRAQLLPGCAPWSAPLSLEIEADARRPAGRGVGEEVGEAGRRPERAMGNRGSPLSFPAGSEPRMRPLGWRCPRSSEAERRAGIDWAARGRRAAT